MIMLLGGCQGEGSTNSFVYDKMIIFNKVVYAVTSESVESVDEKIGSVEKYSTKEEDSNTDSFSNYYPVGTNLYKVPNESVENAIAVEVSKGKYTKAKNYD